MADIEVQIFLEEEDIRGQVDELEDAVSLLNLYGARAKDTHGLSIYCIGPKMSRWEVCIDRPTTDPPQIEDQVVAARERKERLDDTLQFWLQLMCEGKR